MMRLEHIAYESDRVLSSYDSFYGFMGKATRHKDIVCFKIVDEESYSAEYAYLIKHQSGWLLWGWSPYKNWSGPLEFQYTLDDLWGRLSVWLERGLDT